MLLFNFRMALKHNSIVSKSLYEGMRLLLILSFLGVNPLMAQSWQSLSDYPGIAVDDASAFSIGDTAYFGAGLTSWWAPRANFFGLDLQTYQWFSIAALPAGKERHYAAAFSTDFHGYLFGGYNGQDFLNDLWRYNPQLDQWTELSPLPDSGRSGMACFRLGDTAYFVGGKNDSNYAMAEVWA